MHSAVRGMNDPEKNLTRKAGAVNTSNEIPQRITGMMVPEQRASLNGFRKFRRISPFGLTGCDNSCISIPIKGRHKIGQLFWRTCQLLIFGIHNNSLQLTALLAAAWFRHSIHYFNQRKLRSGTSVLELCPII